MDHRSEEYLKLFKQVRQQTQVEEKEHSYDQLMNGFNGQMINETPNYGQRLNETPNYNYNNNLNEVRNFNDYNINDFNIETRVNGQSINEVKTHEEKQRRLNEIMQHKLDEEKRIREQEKLNEILQKQKDEADRLEAEKMERQKLNESVNFSEQEVISLEIFEKARYNSMMNIANRILPK
jgi:hypothetical protein